MLAFRLSSRGVWNKFWSFACICGKKVFTEFLSQCLCDGIVLAFLYFYYFSRIRTVGLEHAQTFDRDFHIAKQKWYSTLFKVLSFEFYLFRIGSCIFCCTPQSFPKVCLCKFIEGTDIFRFVALDTYPRCTPLAIIFQK